MLIVLKSTNSIFWVRFSNPEEKTLCFCCEYFKEMDEQHSVEPYVLDQHFDPQFEGLC